MAHSCLHETTHIAHADIEELGRHTGSFNLGQRGQFHSRGSPDLASEQHRLGGTGWCGPASPACGTTTARQLSPEPCPSLNACLGDTYSGPGCLRRQVQERVRGRGNSLICLLKSPPPPRAPILIRASPSCPAFPPHILPGRSRDAKGSLPGTHQTAPTPHSRAALTRSGSGLVRAGDGGGRTSPSASGSVDLRWKGRLTAPVPAPTPSPPQAGRDGWE